MTVSKIRVGGTDHDLRAKYLKATPPSEVKSIEFITRTTTEDATVATVRKIYGNASTVNNNLVALTATSVFARGFNQWDEEWETGTIATATGANANSQTDCRSKNYIAIFPSTEYHITNLGTANRFYVYYYDAGMVFKSYASLSSSTITNYNFTTPSDGFFMRFVAYQASTHYGMVYNQNICINISDTSKNGTYEPYNGDQIDLDIPTLTGKLNGAGSSVVIFPDGMKKAGTVFDEIVGNKAIKRVGSVDLDTLSFTYNTTYVTDTPVFYARVTGRKAGSSNLLCALYYVAGPARTYLEGTNMAMASHNSSSADAVDFTNSSYSDAASFKTAMSGVKLYYELATSEEYVLDNALQLQYPVAAGGTEMVLPTTGTAPMKMDIIYGNATDVAATMSQNFISVDSMKEFLASLGTQMGGTWSMVFEKGKHTFTFTSN